MLTSERLLLLNVNKQNTKIACSVRLHTFQTCPLYFRSAVYEGHNLKCPSLRKVIMFPLRCLKRFHAMAPYQAFTFVDLGASNWIKSGNCSKR